jgi:hypothetical protein
MHHPTICNILIIVEDYFMLVGDNSQYKIEPIINKDNDSLGILMSRKLLNGYLYIEIKGTNRDSDEIKFSYLENINPNSYLKSIEIECSNYNSDTARNAVRTILMLDKNQTKQKLLC